MSTASIATAAGATAPESASSLAHEIASHPFLHGLKPRHLHLLAESALRADFPAGKFIFHEGESANRFYLIESGLIALESHLRDGPSVEVQTIGTGEALGWSWLFPPCHWNFDARVIEPTKTIFFYGSRLRVQCELDHEFGYELMKRMSQVVIQRLQYTRRQLLEKSS